MQKKFFIKNEQFEGPLDVLLNMIQKKKVSINNVSLSEITDEYIEYLRCNEIKLKNITYFLFTASVLMLMKSKTLLPKIKLEEEEEKDIDILKKRLNFLKKIREVGVNIKKSFEKNILYKKKYRKIVKLEFRPDNSISLKNILSSINIFLDRSEIVKKIPEVRVKKQKTLKEIILKFEEKIKIFLKLNFNEINFSDKKEKSVSFLAILELFRNGKVDLNQEEFFGNIVIKRK